MKVDNSLCIPLKSINLFDDSTIENYIIDRAYILTFATNEEYLSAAKKDLKILFDEKMRRNRIGGK